MLCSLRLNFDNTFSGILFGIKVFCEKLEILLERKLIFRKVGRPKKIGGCPQLKEAVWIGE